MQISTVDLDPDKRALEVHAVGASAGVVVLGRCGGPKSYRPGQRLPDDAASGHLW